MYLTTIRPTLEYAVQVWQDIPEFLSRKLESIQTGALGITFLSLSGYENAPSFSELSSLADRRKQLCRDYMARVSF